MRIVKAGLCFSGPTAYPSNMYLAEITHGNKDYDSNEQAYQCTKATTHDEADLKYAIKVDASEIATTEEWNRETPALLWDLFDKQMNAHPELLERLIETTPLLLIEASKTFVGGGGWPPLSPAYTTLENSKEKMSSGYYGRRQRCGH